MTETHWRSVLQLPSPLEVSCPLDSPFMFHRTPAGSLSYSTYTLLLAISLFLVSEGKRKVSVNDIFNFLLVLPSHCFSALPRVHSHSQWIGCPFSNLPLYVCRILHQRSLLPSLPLSLTVTQGIALQRETLFIPHFSFK